MPLEESDGHRTEEPPARRLSQAHNHNQGTGGWFGHFYGKGGGELSWRILFETSLRSEKKIVGLNISFHLTSGVDGVGSGSPNVVWTNMIPASPISTVCPAWKFKCSRLKFGWAVPIGVQSQEPIRPLLLQNLFSHWLTFKLLGIRYLAGKMNLKCLFHGPLAE